MIVLGASQTRSKNPNSSDDQVDTYLALFQIPKAQLFSGICRVYHFLRQRQVHFQIELSSGRTSYHPRVGL